MIMPKLLFLPRRRYFVNRSLQGRMVLAMVGAAVLSFVFVLVDYYFSFGRNAGWGLDMLEVFLVAQKLPLIQLVVFVFVIVLMTVYLSHRVAGPLVNLEKSLLRVENGDLTTRVQLRPRDELKDVRDAFNRALSSLHRKVSSDRGRAKEMRLLLSQVVATPNLAPSDVAEINRALALLSALTTEFKL
ncbi:MAG: methyl-accepting chemotaxis protein [Elusimicrobia bacterium]|nr:methyl-accepting chemotaxis protein [Elusimicrobiota bacterium]